MDRIIELTLKWRKPEPRTISARKRHNAYLRRREFWDREILKSRDAIAKTNKKWGIWRLEKLGCIWDKTNFNYDVPKIFIDWPLDAKKGGCECYLEYPGDPKDY